jgi:hypothetical protein
VYLVYKKKIMSIGILEGGKGKKDDKGKERMRKRKTRRIKSAAVIGV